MNWRVHHQVETDSTNLDARAGASGDVYTADYQRAGRGRLDHKWNSPRGANLLLSAVIDVGDLAPETVATLPLVVGFAVVRTVETLAPDARVALKWPNDVWIAGLKTAGILCERHGDNVIAGIGVNVARQDFPAELAARATTLANAGFAGTVAVVRDTLLGELSSALELWRRGGFGAIYPTLRMYDALCGKTLSVLQTDADTAPVSGICGGIRPDGSLEVAGRAVYAGEAHVTGLF